ncbi:hypothetical protein AB3X55_11235 [Alphaproteobacteria bacterium LSUCC0719]
MPAGFRGGMMAGRVMARRGPGCRGAGAGRADRKDGDPGGTRTPYLQIRNILLYVYIYSNTILNQLVKKIIDLPYTKYAINKSLTNFTFTITQITIILWTPNRRTTMTTPTSEMTVGSLCFVVPILRTQNGMFVSKSPTLKDM